MSNKRTLFHGSDHVMDFCTCLASGQNPRSRFDGYVQRLFLLLTFIAALAAIFVISLPAHAEPNPLTCAGYPEPRLFVEAQVWWTEDGVSDPHLREHIHTGTCFPVHQKLSRNSITFDIRVVIHDLSLGSVLKRTTIHTVTDSGGEPRFTIDWGNVDVTGPGNQEFWGQGTIDLTEFDVSGYQEFRFLTEVIHGDGDSFRSSTGWQAFIDNGKPRNDFRDGEADNPWQSGRGWYTNRGYQISRIEYLMTEADVAAGGYQVSGVWEPHARMAGGSGGSTPEFTQVVIDAFNHFEGFSKEVHSGSGTFDGNLSIDTTTLSDGLHKLTLRNDDIQTGGSDPGTLSGIQVIPFVVNNGSNPVSDITVTPTSHNYGNVLINTSGSQSIEIRNDGTADLNITGASLLGNAEYSIDSGDIGGGITLTPGQSHNVVMSFNPTAVGAQNDTLRIISDDPDESTVDVALDGDGVIGTDPDITVTPTSYSYGNVLINASGFQSFEIRNDGTTDLNITGTSLFGSAEFSIDNGDIGIGITLTPGQTHNVVVSFNPVTAGFQSDTLRITSNDPDESIVDVALDGNGVIGADPDIAVTPSLHDYGNVLINTSTSQNFEIRNDGTADLTISGTNIVGSAEFVIDSGGALFTLAPGTSQDIVVSFNPTVTGTQSDTLRITSNDPDESIVDVTLDGNGVINPVPDITVTPSLLDYGNVLINTSTSQNFEIRNDGTADLTISGTNIVGSAEFAIDSGGVLFTLAPGASQDIVVSFNPTATGTQSDTLRITSDDPDESTVDVSLDGNGVSSGGGSVTLQPTDDARVYFGSPGNNYGSRDQIRVRDSGNSSYDSYLQFSVTGVSGTPTSAKLRLFVTNGSPDGGDVYVVDNSWDESTITANNAPVISDPVIASAGSVTAGAYIELDVTSAITGNGTISFGMRSGSSNSAFYYSKEGASPPELVIQQSGSSGPNPDITVTPSIHDYGNVLINASATQSFEVRNDGTADLTVSGANIVGSTEFAIDSGGALFTLAPGTSQDIVVSFNPTATGTQNDTLQITSDDPDESIVDVSLDGNGVINPVPDITVTPSLLDYGNVLINASATQSFEVRNDGTADLTISGTNIVGSAEFVIDSGGALFTLAPGASQDIVVSFNPTATGTQNDTLQITSDDPDESIVDVALDGNGVIGADPDITVTPSLHNYGNVLINASATQSFEVRNDGTADLTVSGANIVGSAEFAIDSGGALFTLAPGASQDIVVSFNPTATGTQSDTLRITSDDPDESIVDIALDGNGVIGADPDITVTPSLHDYGNVLINASATQSFEVRNDGTADLTISGTNIVGSAEFVIDSGDAPFTLAPGASQDIVVSFNPTATGTQNDTLQIISDDPDEGAVDVSLDGSGVSSGGGSVTFQPIDDARVNLGFPTSNYGSGNILRVRDAGSSSHESYLKFAITGLTGSPTSAILRLFVTDSSSDGGDIYLVGDNNWDESTINANNAPGISGSPIVSAGAVTSGTLIELDVTSAITGNGTVSFGLAGGSSNSAFYSSKEGANPPELVIQ